MKLHILLSHYGAEPDEQAVEKHIANLEGKLDGYEAILGKQRFLAGDVSVLLTLNVHKLIHAFRVSVGFQDEGRRSGDLGCV